MQNDNNNNNNNSINNTNKLQPKNITKVEH